MLVNKRLNLINSNVLKICNVVGCIDLVAQDKESYIQHLDTFDVALFKGSAWEEQEHMAALHRSCPVAQTDKRVLLTLDPM